MWTRDFAKETERKDLTLAVWRKRKWQNLVTNEMWEVKEREESKMKLRLWICLTEYGEMLSMQGEEGLDGQTRSSILIMLSFKQQWAIQVEMLDKQLKMQDNVRLLLWKLCLQIHFQRLTTDLT